MNRSQRLRARQRAEKQQAKLRSTKQIQQLKAQNQAMIVRQLLAHKTDPTANLPEFVRQVVKKTPKFLCDDVILASLQRMGKLPAIRDLKSWKPRGKSPRALLCSLAKHLFSCYPTPAFLWSVFWQTNDNKLPRMVVKIADGTSLYSLCKSGEFPVQLSKRQCHLFLASPAKLGFVDALRFAQVVSNGGTSKLFNEWRRSPYLTTLLAPDMEQFWQQVLAWLSRQTVIKPGDIHKLMDYFAYQHRQNSHYNLKGRTLQSVTREMLLWQAQMRQLRLAQGYNLPSSGFTNTSWVEQVWQRRKQKLVEEQWAVTEILSCDDLFMEGRNMNHCVYSYRNKIRKGACSIWSVAHNNKPVLTIELCNRNKQVVQVKGMNNREPDFKEWAALRYWAKQNAIRCA